MKNKENENTMNGLQVGCVREFVGPTNELSIQAAKEACASTRIEYGGISETIMSLYDDVEETKTEKSNNIYFTNM